MRTRTRTRSYLPSYHYIFNVLARGRLLTFNLSFLHCVMIIDGIPKTVLNEFTACKKLMEKVKAVEGIKGWMGKYSTPYETFDFE